MVIPNPTLRWFLIRSAKFVIDPLSCFTLSSDSSDQIFECGAAKTLYIRSKTVNISARSDFDNLRASTLMNSAGCRYDSNSPAISHSGTPVDRAKWQKVFLYAIHSSLRPEKVAGFFIADSHRCSLSWDRSKGRRC